ncbi:unnamed protein product [Heligmosomoides polygyrus]|uniref:Neur_chan_memb domain-containing protein n=1 Tax=Heligmosomoides polygyrus TaxID=6339 RepID=A0A183GNG7_HELPZ|nr:unnamed protein product [Heligmosomoides polygyrus]
MTRIFALSGTWSCVTAEFFVKREVTHHVMQSYVPTTLIVVISWFSFWLDVEAVPARVSLAITTLLTLSTQANAARMALPEVSYMKAIDVWMGACMMFVFGVMIEFTIVNYAQRQASSEPLATRKNTATIMRGAQRMLDRFRSRADHRELEEEDLLDNVVHNGGTYDALPGDNAKNVIQMTPPRNERKPLKVADAVKPNGKWKLSVKQELKSKKEAARRRAKQIDQASRWVFPLSFIAFNAIYWSYYLHFKT